MPDLAARPELLIADRLVGLSTDTKPTTTDQDGASLSVGQEFYETDTGQQLYWDGSAWQKTTQEQLDRQTNRILYRLLALLESKE